MADIELEDAGGRKLEKVIEHWGEYLFIFEGGDTTVLTASGGDCGDEASVIEWSFVLEDWLRYDGELLRYGVVTQEQVDECRTKQKLARERDLAAKIAEVERLKREIEGV